MAPIDAFADSDDEAKSRAEIFKKKDPFPSVQQALLSSSNISDYVRVTAMLHPFYPESLKSASYEAHPAGKFIMWDADGTRIESDVQRGEKITLLANSISFIQVEPHFRLPDYIALRFNLRITHVHRGILLGTGPLVDPGFRGSLLIPLHNLTSSDYTIDTDDALIWVEFTKTTFSATPGREEAVAPPHSDFPPTKWDLTPDQYLYKANLGNPIRSSIGGVIESAKNEAERARKAAEDAKTATQSAQKVAGGIQYRVTVGGFVGLAVLIIALVAILIDVRSLTLGGQEVTSTAVQEIGDLSARIERVAIDSATLSGRVSRVDESIVQLSKQLKEIEGQLRKVLEDKDTLEIRQKIKNIEIRLEELNKQLLESRSTNQ